MHDFKWMIYGATGYTGQLVAAEAVARGHAPIIAGRNPERVRALARRLGLPGVAFELDDVNAVAEHIAGMDVVYNAAGPFIFTSDILIRACLATHTHYLDITGEIDVFENTFSYNEAAHKIGISLISGCGFDVIPTDCLNAYVADQVPAAEELEAGVVGFSQTSAGTTKSVLEIQPFGTRLRRDGDIVAAPFGSLSKTLHMPSGDYAALSVPWGDVSVSYHTTGIPNITVYLHMPRPMMTLAKLGAPLMGWLTRSGTFRRAAGALIDRFASGPDEHTRHTVQSYIWSRASNASGMSAEAWLITPEPYEFTARAAVPAVERTMEQQIHGALPPALAFGTDFVLDIEGVTRLDALSAGEQ